MHLNINIFNSFCDNSQRKHFYGLNIQHPKKIMKFTGRSSNTERILCPPRVSFHSAALFKRKNSCMSGEKIKWENMQIFWLLFYVPLLLLFFCCLDSKDTCRDIKVLSMTYGEVLSWTWSHKDQDYIFGFKYSTKTFVFFSYKSSNY